MTSIFIKSWSHYFFCLNQWFQPFYAFIGPSWSAPDDGFLFVSRKHIIRKDFLWHKKFSCDIKRFPMMALLAAFRFDEALDRLQSNLKKVTV